MSSNLQQQSTFSIKHPADADVLHTMGKRVPGEHHPDLAANRMQGVIPVVDGPSRQEVLVERAHANKQFIKEQRAHDMDERLHGHKGSNISNQHSDEANVDGIRNIN